MPYATYFVRKWVTIKQIIDKGHFPYPNNYLKELALFYPFIYVFQIV